MFSDVKSTEIVDLVKPYKIMISLLDKAAIGQLLLDNLFIYILLDLESKVESLEGSPVKFEVFYPCILLTFHFFIVTSDCQYVFSNDRSLLNVATFLPYD